MRPSDRFHIARIKQDYQTDKRKNTALPSVIPSNITSRYFTELQQREEEGVICGSLSVIIFYSQIPLSLRASP